MCLLNNGARLSVTKNLLDFAAKLCYNLIIERTAITMKKKKANISFSTPTYEAMKKIRGDWGDISPVTKVIPNKKKNRKEKHKGQSYEED